MEKQTSSSSEDGLDLSDESNLLDALVLENADTTEQRKRHRTPVSLQPQLTTSGRPNQTKGTEELTPEEHANHVVWLSE